MCIFEFLTGVVAVQKAYVTHCVTVSYLQSRQTTACRIAEAVILKLVEIIPSLAVFHFYCLGILNSSSTCALFL